MILLFRSVLFALLISATAQASPSDNCLHYEFNSHLLDENKEVAMANCFYLKKNVPKENIYVVHAQWKQRWSRSKAHYTCGSDRKAERKLARDERDILGICRFRARRRGLKASACKYLYSTRSRAIGQDYCYAAAYYFIDDRN